VPITGIVKTIQGAIHRVGPYSDGDKYLDKMNTALVEKGYEVGRDVPISYKSDADTKVIRTSQFVINGLIVSVNIDRSAVQKWDY
jgi:hypothetical protein